VDGSRGLYAIVDPDGCAGRTPEEIADAILAGGCGVLQLRVKRPMADRDLVALGRRLRDRCRRAGVPFVVNDRAHLARVLGADGLHLGQDDLSVEDARRVVGSLPIGVSTHGETQALAAAEAGANLIGFGPVFQTSSKARPDPTVGLDGLRSICARVSVPVVAIGGLTVERAPEARAAGAALVAAISAICAAPDPTSAARAMHRAAGGTP